MSETQEVTKEAPKTAAEELRAVYDQLEGGTAETTQEAKAEPAEYSGEEDAQPAPVETDAQKAERLRNEKGQFAKNEPAKDAKVQTKPEPKQDIAPPPNWKGDAKVDWKRLPASVRQELLNDYNERTQLQQRATQFDQVLTPQRRQALQVAYGDETRGLNQILATVEYSNTDPKGFLKWYAQTRGINLNELAAPQQPEQQGYVDPALQQMAQELTGLKQTLAQQQQYAVQTQQSQLYNFAGQKVQEFFAQGDKYPYANDVFDTMMMLVRNKVVTELPDAYDRAVHMIPEVRAKVIALQQQNQLQAKVQDAAAKRNTAVSVAGAPGGMANAQSAIPMVNGRPETATETLRRTMNEMGARF